jgi:hypothetical protein
MRNIHAFLFLPFLLTIVVSWGQDQRLCAGATQSSQCVQRFEELHLQISDLQAKLTRGSKESTLDQQDKCANRAFWAFENWGYKAKENADFVGHYNAALDRCFIQTQNTGVNGEFFWRELFDAYSGEQYGQYGLQRKNREVPLIDCHVILPSGETQSCQSDDEFKKLARVYMGG